LHFRASNELESSYAVSPTSSMISMQFYSKFQLLTCCLNSLELLISISNVYHAATDLHLVVSARGSPVIQPTAIFGPPQNKKQSPIAT